MADIVYISNPLTADNKTSSHHIVWELVKKHRVLYLESGGMRPPKATLGDLRKSINRLCSIFRQPRRQKDNLFVYKLINLPFHGSRVARVLNKIYTITVIRIWQKRLGFKDTILWIFAPDYAHIVGNLGEKKAIYYCTDEHSEMPGVNKEAITALERTLLRKVDMAFFVSQKLYRKKHRLTSNPKYSPHAVDYHHFARANELELCVPFELDGLSTPIVGFVGLIEKWVDLQLVQFLVTNRPDWNFVFVGRIAADVSPLRKYNNILFCGKKPYDELPNFLGKMDVCIIPFKRDNLTQYVNPIKLKEYLAAGRPVVSTPMPELEDLVDHIGIAETPQQFLDRIEFYLKNDSACRKEMRMKLVESDSWENRVNRIVHDVICDNNSG